MYHIVYLTINNVNKKMYVGKQSTLNPNDAYLGSGLKLKRAIKKHGKDSFKKIILHYCLTEKDAFELESSIVDTTFLNRNDVYNMSLGGLGGNKNTMKSKEEIKTSRKKAIETMKNKSIEEQLKYREKLSIASKNTMHLRPKLTSSRKGRPCSEQHKEKLRLSNINKKHNLSESQRKIIGDRIRNRSCDKLTNKYYKIIDNENNIHIIKGTLMKFCKEQNISYATLHKNINKGKITQKRGPYKNYKTLDNWSISVLDND